MGNEYVTRKEFERFKDFVLEELGIKPGKLYQIRLNEAGPKYERACELVLASGSVEYLKDDIMLVNERAVRRLDQEKLPYEKIEQS